LELASNDLKMKTRLIILGLFMAMVISANALQAKVINPGFDCGDTLTDSRDGKKYATVLIGSQCWMKGNMNFGTLIQEDLAQINNGIPEKYCYDNLETNCDVYGGLYQWNEVMQYVTEPKSRGICPEGWHVPANEEWDTLVAFLGGDVAAGGKMKQAGDANFLSPNIGATNKSGFSALPGGYSYSTGSYYFSNLQKVGYFWSSTADNETDVWFRSLGYSNEKIGRHVNYKSTGASVRCMRDH
jgi:uncharacterized protein (TIGR02145 family)